MDNPATWQLFAVWVLLLAALVLGVMSAITNVRNFRRWRERRKCKRLIGG